MKTLIRTGISLEKDLLRRFDHAARKKGYTNRSEAIRDLVRDFAVREDIREDRPVVGTLTMVYNHHQRDLAGRLIDTQHRTHPMMLATTHVHLDHDNCLEVVLMKGRSRAIQELADRILSLRGVKHGRLVLTTTGQGPK